MLLKTTCLFIFLLCFSRGISAQIKYTISGSVNDKKTGETITGTIISVIELDGVGAASNDYGFYSITLPQGEYTLLVNSIGYVSDTITIKLDKDIKLAFQLEEELANADEVIITGKKEDQQLTDAQMGVERLDMKETAKIPVFMGEKDILKTLQLLPGVKSSGDGGSGINVRGGSIDQNLILLDEATVYNASHLLGFFSTFNSDAIKDVSIFKSGMPAQYGGRLSSVLDVKMKDGNDKSYHASGGIGIIASRLNLEGPIVKNKGSFLISGRRTYADAFLKLSPDKKLSDNKLYFYDVNAKANYRINENNRVFFSGYFGKDKIGLGSAFGIDWGNTTATLRWNHVINSKWFSNTSLIYSNYNYKISISSGGNDFSIKSTIKDYNLKQEFQFFPNVRNSLKIGFNSIYHTITPGQILGESSNINPVKLQDRYAWENAVYISNDWDATDRLKVIYGLRISSFSVLGKGDFYSYDQNGKVTDTTSYSSGKLVKNYINPEPRFSASYRLNTLSSLKGSYARNVQNLHLISNSTSGSPTDAWIASSNNVKPEISDQVSLGYYRNFKAHQYEFSLEGYYKSMQNQIDYKNGANVTANDKLEGELLFGKGRAYGIEFLLKKKTGKLTGWVGYTLSRTEKQIDGINNGNWYTAKQDRTHDISIVGIYDLSKKWSLSATWVYNTGNAVTFPSGKYTVDGQVQFSYTERNGARMPAYHRLDIGATWFYKKTDKFEASWNFSLYNAYGRQNAYTITFRESESDPSKTEAVKTSLFRWIPSITYNFKF